MSYYAVTSRILFISTFCLQAPIPTLVFDAVGHGLSCVLYLVVMRPWRRDGDQTRLDRRTQYVLSLLHNYATSVFGLIGI